MEKDVEKSPIGVDKTLIKGYDKNRNILHGGCAMKRIAKFYTEDVR